MYFQLLQADAQGNQIGSGFVKSRVPAVDLLLQRLLVPADEAALINMINSLKGTVSDETLLAQLPFINDVQLELEKVRAQKESNLDLFGGNYFDSSESESQEEETDEIETEA